MYVSKGVLVVVHVPAVVCFGVPLEGRRREAVHGAQVQLHFSVETLLEDLASVQGQQSGCVETCESWTGWSIVL